MKKTFARALLAASLLLAPAAFADVAVPDGGAVEADAGTAPSDGGTTPASNTGCSAAGGFGAGGLIFASVAAAFALRRKRK